LGGGGKQFKKAFCSLEGVDEEIRTHLIGRKNPGFSETKGLERVQLHKPQGGGTAFLSAGSAHGSLRFKGGEGC